MMETLVVKVLNLQTLFPFPMLQNEFQVLYSTKSSLENIAPYKEHSKLRVNVGCLF